MTKIKLILISIIFLSLCSIEIASADNDCESMAMDYQNIYQGDLIFVQPLKENGAYDLGRYNGHWLNFVHGEYIDAGSGMILSSPSAWFNQKSESWNVNQGEHPPFSLIYSS